MQLYFYTEARFVLAKDGKIYNPNGVQKRDVFKRYLEVFENINIIARVKKDNNYIIDKNHIVEGDNIKVFPIAYYNGFLDYLSKYFIVQNDIKKIVLNSKNAVHILRLPGNIGTIASKYLMNYGVEVVGDPFDVFDTKFYKNPLLYILKYKAYYDLKRIVKKSNCALYVTRYTLQKRYPNRNMFSASNVKILKDDIISKPKKLVKEDVKLLSIGTLEQLYKSPDVVIELIKELREEGINISLNWIGEGKYKESMLYLVKKYNLKSCVSFIGYISNKNLLYQEIDNSDIFIIASKTEGLPRVVIEVFSRGLPVIGTAVGGIPELVSNELLCKVDDISQMKFLIKKLISDKEFYESNSKKNIEISKGYTEDILQKNRVEFYKSLINIKNER